MYLYFSSDYPAIIKLNGIYYGRIDNAVKNCNFSSTEPPFVEVCPLVDSQPQINFICDAEFFANPPSSATLTDLKGGYFIKFNKSYLTEGFSVLAQEKFTNAVVTVFSENGYKLSIETAFDFYAQTLKMQVESATISQKQVNGDSLILVMLEGNVKIFSCFKINDKIEQLFWREVDSAEFDKNLVTTNNLPDIAKHGVERTWSYKNGKFEVLENKVKKSPSFNKELLHERLIPYAFLEEFNVGGEYQEYIDGTVKENADRLKNFLGEFVGVCPPPTFRKIEEVGLIYHDKANVYHVEYFTFTLENRKIININKG